MKSKYHFIYLSIILILSTLLLKEYWMYFQVEKNIEEAGNLFFPEKSTLTDEQLIGLYENVKADIEEIKSPFKNCFNVEHVSILNEDVSLSIFSKSLIENPELFHNTPNFNLGMLGIEENIQINVIDDSLVISTNDSTLISTIDWRVEFYYNELIEEFSNFLLDQKISIDKIIEQLNRSNLYAVKSLPIANSNELLLFYIGDDNGNHFIFMENYQIIAQDFPPEEDIAIEQTFYQIHVINNKAFLTPTGAEASIIKLNE
ncbi:hypothetical protein R9C00_25190 [Flammeovirgaceae bacterium SG7u.111]|nr:hypothetical protein [Flammeovirgaceae bacterium SG7u.132]WPO34993.1 hypothetical protein R9C00_25190 [Flammeovirgaceae bacterium SG7u.111]